ncbi:MAG TPA: 1-(5-phosphoribosyl)-5-[(5-phosphoribosylamino)methylideneamino]imidazole-4-carboxamide isomerase [Patescibacteria group bacterium]|nr:1-(5-phosphoribosyl)-5-[(5-phosphoribosylamino)methylideneamino]imidazole-4-carboxamide isomerase [Patescibacteria group bacterium]
MIVYPAIDLRGGRCVRLLEGAFERETVYGDDPVAVARGFAAAGARWLHVVDLDGARAGRPVQADLVAAICAAVRIPVQVGGGLRDGAAVESALAAGAARAVLGTLAVADPERAAAICGAHPGRVAIGLDARDGRLRVAGWTAGAETTATAAAAGAAGLGAAAVIYTDIGRDGTERGPDLDGTRAVARAAGGVPVIASGGIGALDHVRAVAALGVAGVIIGRALYTGAVRLADALAVTQAA